jgi:branched-chain amino acid transport system substrate-binding protein
LSTYDDKGLYFRTAPSDVLQGEVLGNLIAADGHENIAMIVLNDSYGTGLASFVTEAFEAAGGKVLAAPTYNTGDTNFTSQIAEVLATDPLFLVLADSHLTSFTLLMETLLTSQTYLRLEL